MQGGLEQPVTETCAQSHPARKGVLLIVDSGPTIKMPGSFCPISRVVEVLKVLCSVVKAVRWQM